MRVKVIGAGLAGCEAALQLAKYGIGVQLFEMKPKKFSPAHKSEGFAELVCSNSLKADRIENACGLLKEEMRLFGSVIMEAADASRVPAGGALAVDRNVFSEYITDKINSEPLIEVVHDEAAKIDPDEYTVIAAGPLVSDALSEEMVKALCALSPEDRAIVYGRVVDECGYGELAQRFGKSEAWARKRYSLARKRLAALLVSAKDKKEGIR